MKLLQHQAEALVRLRESPDFKAFLHVMGGHAELKNQQLIMRDDINTDLCRGELRAYAMIQDAVDSAPAMVAKFKQSLAEEHANGTP